MKKTNTQNTITGRLVSRANERIVHMVLSVVLPSAHSPKQSAVAHIYTQLLQSGAGKYTREGYQEALGKLGSHIDITESNGHLDVHLTSLDVATQKTYSLLKTVITEPHLSAKECARIKKQLHEQLKVEKENARALSAQMFSAELYRASDRRRGYAPDQLIQEIKKISLSDIKKFHNQVWTSSWVYTIGGTSDVTTTLENNIKKLRSSFEVSHQDSLVHQPLNIEKTKVILTDIPAKENIEINIGADLTLTATEDEYPAIIMGLTVLGIRGGFAGRLMSTVREKEGLTYGIYADILGVTHNEQGIWRIWTFFAPKDALKGITSTLKQLNTIVSNGITDDELKRFKQILHTRRSLIADSFLTQVTHTHVRQLSGIDDEQYEATQAKLQTLTLKEVNAAMQKYIHPKKLIIAGAGPVERVKKDLEKIAT